MAHCIKATQREQRSPWWSVYSAWNITIRLNKLIITAYTDCLQGCVWDQHFHGQGQRSLKPRKNQGQTFLKLRPHFLPSSCPQGQRETSRTLHLCTLTTQIISKHKTASAYNSFSRADCTMRAPFATAQSCLLQTINSDGAFFTTILSAIIWYSSLQ